MRPAVLVLASVIAVASAVASPGAASAGACDEEAAELRAHLEVEARRARRWNTAWAVGFGAAAAAQLALGVARWNPLGAFDRDFEEMVYVNAAKASVGMLARVVLPLRVSVPRPAADPCAEVAALRGALADAARRERRSFWLTHIGGTALNLAGAALLTYRRSLRIGAISFAMSYPIGPLHAYTQPRRSWHRWRAPGPTWRVGLTGGAVTTLWIGGEL